MRTTFTIDDAIGQCEAAAAALEKGYHDPDGNWCKCASIAAENRQMAEWLKKLKAYEEAKEKTQPKHSNWIPIKWHEITEEEREREGYPEEWGIICDSRLPEDGTDTLIQTKWGIDIAPFCEDESGAYWEQYETPGEVIAWQPLPESYEEGSEKCRV